MFDVGFHQEGDQRITFLTMELLDGESLRERLSRGTMSPSEALPIVEQVVAGLSAAHRVGVVHRDLTCANILLVRDGAGCRAVITDFGLARGTQGAAFDQSSTGQSFLVGTPLYMAPEQVTGEALSAATDVYSLGVVLFKMVTGAMPFVGATAGITAIKRLHEPPPSPRHHRPDLPLAWEKVILKCLEREPARRYAPIDEVARVLREAVSQGIAPGRRSLRGPVLLVAGALTAVAVGTFAFRAQRVALPPPPAPMATAPAESPPAPSSPAAVPSTEPSSLAAVVSAQRPVVRRAKHKAKLEAADHAPATPSEASPLQNKLITAYPPTDESTQRPNR
jgi:serine/threonine protein kinase